MKEPQKNIRAVKLQIHPVYGISSTKPPAREGLARMPILQSHNRVVRHFVAEG
jgi:hypothetical protein